MPKKTEFEKKRDRIYKKTVLKMKELGTYKARSHTAPESIA